MDLSKDVKYVKGVGEARAKILNKLGIYTLEDLIMYYPRTYEDRSMVKSLNDVQDGDEVLIKATVVTRMNIITTRNRRMTICKMLVRDETDVCEVVWYNQPYLKQRFKIGEEYNFFGKISKKTGHIVMQSPVFDREGLKNNTGKIIPLYPLTYGISQNQIRKIIENGLGLVKEKLDESLPEYVLNEYKLMNLNSATHKIHFPENFEEFEKARFRLAFEELLTMQLLLLDLKNKCLQKQTGIQFDKNVHMSDVINELPFKLTKAQIRALGEIDNDMEQDKVMNRLLQGDVGSRKDCSCDYSSI